MRFLKLWFTFCNKNSKVLFYKSKVNVLIIFSVVLLRSYIKVIFTFNDLYFQSIDHRCLLYVSSSWAIEDVRHHFCFRVVTWRYSVHIKPSVVAFLWLNLATGSDGNLVASQNLSNNIARDRSLPYSYF